MPYEKANVEDQAYRDGKIAAKTIRDLKKLKSKDPPGGTPSKAVSLVLVEPAKLYFLDHCSIRRTSPPFKKKRGDPLIKGGAGYFQKWLICVYIYIYIYVCVCVVAL